MANIFFLPSQAEFLRKFPQNDAIIQRVNLLWQEFDNWSMILLFVTAVIVAGLACYYYGPYNKKPGRHYKMKYWWIFLIASWLLTLVLTIVAECWGISTSLPFDKMLSIYLQIVLINTFIYSTSVYFITSVIICNWGKTNAYRHLKFKKS